KCGKELPDDADFCSDCGAKLRQEEAKETDQNHSSDVKPAVDDKDAKNFFTKNKYRNSFLTAGLVIVLLIICVFIFGKSSNKFDYFLDRYGKINEECDIETNFYKKNKDAIIPGKDYNIDENTEIQYGEDNWATITIENQDTIWSGSTVRIELDGDKHIYSKSSQSLIVLDGWSYTNDEMYKALCGTADGEFENLVNIYTKKFGKGTPYLPFDGELGELLNQEGVKWTTKDVTISIAKYYGPSENTPQGEFMVAPIVSIVISRIKEK
ncbi:MAG: zinc ribbon domain-containing protein, partial [Lachnospiraceae bacterium]|nr:zinc ribbon domain-containing protein [Lachnospiraceae bacterium]